MEHFLRNYRRGLCPSGMDYFTVAVKETDLWVAVGGRPLAGDLPRQLEQYIWQQRRRLEKYLAGDPLFRETFEPYLVGPDAPAMAREMVRAGNTAGVGPMAAVAGTFAQYAGMWLLQKYPQVIVENGGDLFICCPQEVKVGIYAGSSPFSGKLAVRVRSDQGSRGLCTSSGTVGPSLSRGRADAAVILAQNASLADAVATAAGNQVQSAQDLKNALNFAAGLPGVEGALIVKDDRMAVWGDIQLEKI